MLIKLIITIPMFIAVLWAFNSSSINAKETTTSITSFYDYKVKLIDEKEISLSQFKGKKLLIVNVASKCGYTKQYEDLQKLYDTHGDKVEILGFPCNDFGSQEPGTSSEIASFCRINYGVTFTIAEKIQIKGENIHPVYEWLTNEAANGWNSSKPSWNFCKYLIDEKGNLKKFYRSGVKPMSDELIADIMN